MVFPKFIDLKCLICVSSSFKPIIIGDDKDHTFIHGETFDVDGDGDEDLVVYNKDNLATQYLGILRSDPVGATFFSARGSWQDDWINGWNLGSSDKFHVAEFRGGANWADLYVFNAGWFGMLRSHSNHFRQETIYRKWIYNHRYHGAGLW